MQLDVYWLLLEASEETLEISPGSAGRHAVGECNYSTRHRHGEGTSMPLLGKKIRAGWEGHTKSGRPRTRGRQQCTHETRKQSTSEPAAPKSA
eukprot:4674641-Prymnesium_polylepis.1